MPSTKRSDQTAEFNRRVNLNNTICAVVELSGRHMFIVGTPRCAELLSCVPRTTTYSAKDLKSHVLLLLYVRYGCLFLGEMSSDV